MSIRIFIAKVTPQFMQQRTSSNRRFSKSCLILLHTSCWVGMLLGDSGLLNRPGYGQGTNAAGEVTVQLFDGSSKRGFLIAADGNKIVLQTATGNVEFSALDTSHIAFSAKVNAEKQAMELFVVDGSRVAVKRLSIQGNAWKFVDFNDREISVVPKSLKAFRVAKLSEAQETAWQSMLREPSDSDAIVVVRGSETLDRIQGIISKVDDDGVSFELDGQQIDIRFAKLGGITWFSKATERVRPTVEIDTLDGSRFMTEEFSVQGKSLAIQTPSGLKLSLPMSSIAKINYGSANVKWITELEILESVAEKSIEFRTPISALDKVLAPRFVVEGAAKGSAVAAGDKDLYFPGPGRFVFRAPDGFTTLQTTVQRSDVGDKRSDVTIEVWQDDQRVFQKPLRFDQETLDVIAPVQSGKKIRLTVASDSKLQIGTDVHWKQPRLKK